MTPERWSDLVESVKEKYEVLENEMLPCDDGIGTVHTLVFAGPGGRIKLEFVIRPIKLATKTHYSKRIGAGVAVENQYSETENTHTLKAYLWQRDSDEWQEINADNFSA